MYEEYLGLMGVIQAGESHRKRSFSLCFLGCNNIFTGRVWIFNAALRCQSAIPIKTIQSDAKNFRRNLSDRKLTFTQGEGCQLSFHFKNYN